MAQPRTPTTIRVDPQGRLVIPVALRKTLRVEAGTELFARLEGEQLILERREAVERRLKARFAHIPKEVSLADQLLAERRQARR
ncbi:MAG: AbrB/MazE/SpoVT family DNA-binding domain-containing protein [Truepera sp.]|nr:AbrB/MazE/SpoVT family DNA-binding domain-containing protein [Truepera sp.]